MLGGWGTLGLSLFPAMTLDTANDLVNAGGQFLCFGAPLIIFLALRRRYPAPTPSGNNAAGTILVCWILLFSYRELTRGITVDYINAHPPSTRNPEDGPYMYDGVGGNVLIMVFGWVPAVFALTVLFALRRLWRWIRRKPSLPEAVEELPPI